MKLEKRVGNGAGQRERALFALALLFLLSLIFLSHKMKDDSYNNTNITSSFRTPKIRLHCACRQWISQREKLIWNFKVSVVNGSMLLNLPQHKVLYQISPNNSQGANISSFRFKRGRLFEGRRLFEGDDYFKYCLLEVVP